METNINKSPTPSPILVNCSREQTTCAPPVWKRIPNTSFGVGMGLAGQAILWRSVQKSKLFGASFDGVARSFNILFWATSLLFSALALVLYVRKAIFHYSLIKDEIRDGSRVHFCNMPHLILAMLAIGVPTFVEESISGTGRVVCYAVSLAAQLYSTSFIYQTWLFSDDSNITCSRPQFLLSLVGWFVLSALGSELRIDELWSLDLPTFCLGIGLLLYFMVTISIFNSLHTIQMAKGSPALFLLMAPPSIGVVAWDNIQRHMMMALNNNSDSDGSPMLLAMGSQMLLGWCMGLLLLLFRIGPMIMQRPPVLGAYWAYVFPLAALATAMVRYATLNNKMPALVLAVVFVMLAVLGVGIVCCRTLVHVSLVVRGKAEWDDPLLEEDMDEGEATA